MDFFQADLGNSVLALEFTGQNPGFNLADLLVGKTLHHGDVFMWLMEALLTSGCTINEEQVMRSTLTFCVIHLGTGNRKRAMGYFLRAMSR